MNYKIHRAQGSTATLELVDYAKVDSNTYNQEANWLFAFLTTAIPAGTWDELKKKIQDTKL